MKDRKQSTPAPDPQPQTTDQDTWEDGPNPHLKGEIRRLLLQHWSPQTRPDAFDILEETVNRAGALTSILVEYTWDHSRVSCSQLRDALALLDDLLYLGYSMIEWWDRDEEDQP